MEAGTILMIEVFQNSRARQKKYQGSKKGHRINSGSGRSSTDPSGSPKSPETDSCDGMVFPTSVLTSAEDAMITEPSSMLTSSLSKADTTDSTIQENVLLEEP
ncbi:hypothetical protein AB6A40_008129 [Gnathostoma spinigerum]|uniref:Uncharacterized protein n=1 Tax=Gnathostoma spinigerum TaxID=75299 RepID=A0ABD6EYS8_9BILA